MRRRLLIIFFMIVSTFTAGVIGFIQSERFARIVKGVIARHIPADLGIAGNFSDLRVTLFPPGVSIRSPMIELHEKNALHLPPGSTLRAKEVHFNFYPLQLLSGQLRVSEIVIVEGDIAASLSIAELKRMTAKETKKSKMGFNWDELFQLRMEAVSLVDTKINFDVKDPDFKINLLAKKVEVSQDSRKGGVGYQINLDLMDVNGSYPDEFEIPKRVKRFEAEVFLNALGAQMDRVRLEVDSGSIEVLGQATGDPLEVKTLKLTAEVQIDADLEKIPQEIKQLKFLSDKIKGRAKFKGKVSADLRDALKTLQANGEIEILSGKYDAWPFDKVAAQASWKDLQLNVEKVEVTKAQVERKGGTQAGSGGSIRLDPFSLSFVNGELEKKPMAFKASINSAHIHWLASPVLADVYALDLRINGSLNARYAPATSKAPWSLDVGVDLDVPHLQLDNQRLGKVKPLSKVLDIPNIKLAGEVHVDSRAITPKDLKLGLNYTQLSLSGEIDFAKGYNLKAQGDLDLKEVNKIADVDIRGIGFLEAHVHGPSNKVLIDFDVDATDVEYLNLKLGDMTGRITWDDDPQIVHFSGIQAEKGSTVYKANGQVRAGQDESVDLRFDFEKGDIAELSSIFQFITKDLWWYPTTLTGDNSGTIRVQGGLSLDRLIVKGDFMGSRWSYFGEKFETVHIVGGFDKGEYSIDRIDAIKYKGRINGKIAYQKDGTITWGIKTSGMSINDFDHVARLDVPIRGEFAINSSGKSIGNNLESQTNFDVTEVLIRGESFDNIYGQIKTDGGILNLNATLGNERGHVRAEYAFKKGQPSKIDFVANGFDFAPVLLILNSKLIEDPALRGSLSGKLSVRFKTGEIEFASGNAELTEYSLFKTGSKIQLSKPFFSSFQDGNFLIDGLHFTGNGGTAQLYLSGRQGILNGKLESNLDFSFLEFITSSVERASGDSTLDLNISGSLKNPLFRGRMRLKDVDIKIRNLESPIENMIGQIELKQDLIIIKEMKSDLAGGRLSIDGTTELFSTKFPTLNLKAQLSNNRLKIYPFQYLKINGGLNVTGSTVPYLVKGQVNVDSGLSTEKVLNSVHAKSFKLAKYTPTSSSLGESDFSLLRLDVGVIADKGIMIKNDLFDAEVKGNLRVINTLELPRLLGTAETIRGKMRFKEEEMDIESAFMEFDNPLTIDPKFVMTSSTTISNTKIRIHAHGRVSQWDVDLSSTPVLPESEILSLLTLGLTSQDLRKFRSDDQTAIQQGGAASLLLHSFDFNRDVKDKTGFQIGVEESVDSRTGKSIFRPQTETETGAAPKVVIKKKVGKRLDLSVGTTVGVGTGSEKEVNAEVQVTPGMSVIGVWETFEGTENREEEQSYGIDVKLKKRFK